MQAQNGINQPQALTPGLLKLHMYIGKHCHIALSLSLSSVKESFSHSKNLVSPCPGPFTELKTPLNISPLKMAELWRIGVVYEVKTKQWQLLMENPK